MTVNNFTLDKKPKQLKEPVKSSPSCMINTLNDQYSKEIKELHHKDLHF